MDESSVIERYKQLESEYKLLAESALECIWRYDIKTERFVYMSPSVWRLRGVTDEDSVRQSLAELMPRDSLQKARDTTKLLESRYLNGERNESMLSSTEDFEIYCKDGAIRQVEASVKLVQNVETGALEIIGVSRDISDRKQLEEQLNQAIKSKNEIIERLRESERALTQLTEELNQKNRVLSELATRDTLTGINNRYRFDQKVAEETDRCIRYNYPLSIVLFDIDNFKTVNDTLGHQAGDRVLVKIAGIVSGLVRKHDVFARWGGDEFIVLMPQTALTDAAKAAEKLRREIEEIRCADLVAPVTVSFGVAEFVHDESAESWFKRADYALFCSKGKGRNRVTAISGGKAISFIQNCNGINA